VNDVQAMPPDLVQALRVLLAAAVPQQPGVTPQPRKPDEDLLTINEAARRLRMSRMTIDRAIKAGEFPVIQCRRTYRVPAAFVDRVVTAAKAGAQVVVEDYAAQWVAEQDRAGAAAQMATVRWPS